MERNFISNTFNGYKDPHNYTSDNSYHYDLNKNDVYNKLIPQSYGYYPTIRTDIKADKYIQYKSHYDNSNTKYKEYSYYSQCYEPNQCIGVPIQYQQETKNKSYFYDCNLEPYQNIKLNHNSSTNTFPLNTSLPNKHVSTSIKNVPNSQNAYTNYNYIKSTDTYSQNCNTEMKTYWDEHCTNQRYPTYYNTIPQTNLSNFEAQNVDFYHVGPYQPLENNYVTNNSACAINTRSGNSNNLFNNRPAWPTHLQHQTNYPMQSQNLNFYPPKQDPSAHYYFNSVKQSPNQTYLQTRDYKSDPYYLKRSCAYNQYTNATPAPFIETVRENCTYESCNIPYGTDKVHFFGATENENTHILPQKSDNENNHFNNNHLENLSEEKTEQFSNKRQNLREFLSSWNEDEEDQGERIENIPENGSYLQNSGDLLQSNYETDNILMENNTPYKNTLTSRPKIHVGITLDSNVTSSQYINLPDIIIDIEKSRDYTQKISKDESENISDSYVFEKLEIPFNELSECSETITDSKYLTKNTVSNSFVEEICLQSNQNEILSINEIQRENLNQGKNICDSFKNKNFKLKRKSLKFEHSLNNRKSAKYLQSSLSKRQQLFYKNRKLNLNGNREEGNINNVQTLTQSCLEVINSETFRYFLASKNKENSNTKQIEKGAILRNKIVPSLSDLCEKALSYLYEKGYLILNIENNINDNLYYFQCDINENLLNSDENFENNIVLDIETANSNNFSMNECMIKLCDNQTNLMLGDSSSIHHEEIVPETFKSLENHSLLRYLQSKYMEKTNLLKMFTIKKIIKKYRNKFYQKKLNSL